MPDDMNDPTQDPSLDDPNDPNSPNYIQQAGVNVPYNYKSNQQAMIQGAMNAMNKPRVPGQAKPGALQSLGTAAGGALSGYVQNRMSGGQQAGNPPGGLPAPPSSGGTIQPNPNISSPPPTAPGVGPAPVPAAGTDDVDAFAKGGTIKGPRYQPVRMADGGTASGMNSLSAPPPAPVNGGGLPANVQQGPMPTAQMAMSPGAVSNTPGTPTAPMAQPQMGRYQPMTPGMGAYGGGQMQGGQPPMGMNRPQMPMASPQGGYPTPSPGMYGGMGGSGYQNQQTQQQNPYQQPQQGWVPPQGPGPGGPMPSQSGNANGYGGPMPQNGGFGGYGQMNGGGMGQSRQQSFSAPQNQLRAGGQGQGTVAFAGGGTVLGPPSPPEDIDPAGSTYTEPGAAMRRYSPVSPVAPKAQFGPKPEEMAHHLPTKLKIGKRLNVRLPRPTSKGLGSTSMSGGGLGKI